jgi:hypothetical protein
MEWLRRMMMGRYGTDQLSIALLIVYGVLSLAARAANLFVLVLLSFVPLILCFYRMFSRNISRRYQENVQFLKWWGPVRLWFQNTGNRIKDRRTHRYYKCPKCSSTLRVPKGRGKISITCPVCKTQFVKKT